MSTISSFNRLSSMAGASSALIMRALRGLGLCALARRRECFLCGRCAGWFTLASFTVLAGSFTLGRLLRQCVKVRGRYRSLPPPCSALSGSFADRRHGALPSLAGSSFKSPRCACGHSGHLAWLSVSFAAVGLGALCTAALGVLLVVGLRWPSCFQSQPPRRWRFVHHTVGRF